MLVLLVILFTVNCTFSRYLTIEQYQESKDYSMVTINITVICKSHNFGLTDDSGKTSFKRKCFI